MLFSCAKDETKAVLNLDAMNPVLTSGFQDGQSLVITSSMLADSVIVDWQKPEFGFQASTVNTLQIVPTGGDFSKAQIVGTTTTTDNIVVSLNSLNNILIGMQDDPNAPVATVVQMRLATTLAGVTMDPMYSDTISVTITPYAVPIVWSYLYVAGDFQGWSPSTADFIKSPSNGEYEGYINMMANPADTVDVNYKFTSQADWNGTNYGATGVAGTLSTDPGAGNLVLPKAIGYYHFKVNTNTLTYTAERYNVGLVGAFDNWSSPDSKMTYDNTKNVWKITIDLPAGEFKFRLNDDWGTSWGGDVSNIVENGGNLSIATAGNYTITLNLYKAPFSCTIVKN